MEGQPTPAKGPEMPSWQTIAVFMIFGFGAQSDAGAGHPVHSVALSRPGPKRGCRVSLWAGDRVGHAGGRRSVWPFGPVRLFAARLCDRQILRRRLSHLSRYHRLVVGRHRRDRRPGRIRCPTLAGERLLAGPADRPC